jgi:hypothetical protein
VPFNIPFTSHSALGVQYFMFKELAWGITCMLLWMWCNEKQGYVFFYYSYTITLTRIINKSGILKYPKE